MIADSIRAVSHDKPAAADHDVHPLIRDRWSPRAFGDRPVEPAVLARLFEAARWAPSCANAQPWSFVFAHKADTAQFSAILDCLKPGNQKWADRAAVLMVSVAQLDFIKPGKPNRPNRHAYHDIGLAVAHLGLQATALGLVLHQMAGFDAGKARLALGIPEGHEAVTAIALGYPGDPAQLVEDLRVRELAPRTRKPQEAFVFRGTWAGD